MENTAESAILPTENTGSLESLSTSQQHDKCEGKSAVVTANDGSISSLQGSAARIRRSKRRHSFQQYGSIRDSTPRDINCPYCDETFVASKLFLSHVFEVHAEFVERNKMKTRKGTSSSMIYKCRYCPAVRHKANIIRLHMVRRHQLECDTAVIAKLRRYPCPKDYCVRTYFTKQEAVYHARKCINQAAPKWDNAAIFTPNHRSTRLKNCFDACKEKAVAEKPFECQVCHKQFREHWVTVRHENNHYIRNKPFAKLTSTGDDDDSCKCPHCDKKFHRRQYLKDHIAFRHDGIIKYQCQKCSEAFASCTVYCRHMNSKHPELGDTWKKRKNLPHSRIVGIGDGREVYKCEVCDDIFGSEREVERHMGIHDKSYMCQVCRKTFSNKTSLSNHQHIHEGLRPYVCRYCEKSFRSKANRYQHEQIHKGEKSYVCPICHEGFAVQSTLRNHLYKYKKHGVVPFPEKKLISMMQAGDFVQSNLTDEDMWGAAAEASSSDSVRRSQRKSKAKQDEQLVYSSAYDSLFEGEDEPAIISLKNTTIYEVPDNSEQDKPQVATQPPRDDIDVTPRGGGKRAFNPDDLVKEAPPPSREAVLSALKKSLMNKNKSEPAISRDSQQNKNGCVTTRKSNACSQYSSVVTVNVGSKDKILEDNTAKFMTVTRSNTSQATKSHSTVLAVQQGTVSHAAPKLPAPVQNLPLFAPVLVSEPSAPALAQPLPAQVNVPPTAGFGNQVNNSSHAGSRNQFSAFAQLIAVAQYHHSNLNKGKNE